jgi:BirA family biotin operon repressor/biotin-[acetyl-CoA-carboxylase] ligase
VARGCEQALREAGARIPGLLLKWPNDLLMGRRKIGGILCETGPDSGVLVGVGINVRVDPEGFPASLRGSAGALEGLAGVSLSRGKLLGRILQEMRSGALEGGEEFSREEEAEYRTRDALWGMMVRSETGGGGIARGLTRKGALLLEKEDGRRTEVMAGSVELAE